MADAPKKENPSGNDDVNREDEGVDEDEHLYDDWDDLATDPEEMSRLGRALEGILPDIVKRGVGGLVSDEGIRSLVTDRGLPREAVGFIMGQVDATKREVVRMVSKEVRMFLENVDLGGELTKILTSVSFEVRTEVRFIPNDSAVKPNVRNRVSMRNRRGEGDEEKKESSSPEEWDEEDLDEPSEAPKGRPRRRRWPLGRGREEEDESTETDAETPDKTK